MTGWTLDIIDRLPLPRVWAFLRNWKLHPPMHRLFALFLEYEKGEAAPAKKSGLQITPAMLQAFGGQTGQVCRQSQLHPRIRRSVEEFQATPAYKNWRAKLSQRDPHGKS